MISFDLSFFVLHLDIFLNIELVDMKYKVYVHVTVADFGYIVYALLFSCCQNI
jgi:hypothetical protein